MNKLKRLVLFIELKTLRISRLFLGNEFYRSKSLRYFNKLGVVYPNGLPKFINYDVVFDLTSPNIIFVGKGSVITQGTLFLTHDYSIECGLVAIGKEDNNYEMNFLREIHVGNNSFIGARSIILPGTIIGDNCIIGSGSVVRGNIPSNCIYSGNPAVFICNTAEWAQQKYDKKEYYHGTIRKSSILK